MSPDSYHWKEKTFAELTSRELYDAMNLRQEVFIVEQQAPYLDADNVDQVSIHLLAYFGESLQGYARLVPPGVKYPEPSLGRIVLRKESRGTGFSRILVGKAIQKSKDLYPDLGIRISAQHPLASFYRSFDFQEVGDVYDEDGIPHIEMFLV